MMNRTLILLLTVATMAACSGEDEYSLDYFMEHYGAGAVDQPDTLAVTITFDGLSATVTGADQSDSVTVSRGAKSSDVIINSTLNRYLQLTLTGQTADGSLLIYSQRKLGICLNGVDLTNTDGPAINNQCSKALYLTLAEGTSNTLTDGTTYTDAPLNTDGTAIDQKGTLFSEGQIYVQGNGSLTVNGNARNGIATDDYLVFEGGAVSVNVAATGSNGVKANDGCTISGGTLTIDVAADGARGIRCEAQTAINGGSTTITTTGDCRIEALDGVTDTTSCAGIKSDSLFTMTAGELRITSTGDGGKGINCSENVEINGGTLVITTTGSNDVGKPKGVKSDTGIILRGGSFHVTVSKSWACDNGTDSETPADRLTIEGTPVKKTLEKRLVQVEY